MRSNPRKVVLSGLVLAVTAVLSAGMTGASAGSRYTLTSFQKVARGLVYERITDHQGPNEAFVLKLNPTA